jgi:hypothetical protein
MPSPFAGGTNGSSATAGFPSELGREGPASDVRNSDAVTPAQDFGSARPSEAGSGTQVSPRRKGYGCRQPPEHHGILVPPGFSSGSAEFVRGVDIGQPLPNRPDLGGPLSMGHSAMDEVRDEEDRGGPDWTAREALVAQDALRSAGHHLRMLLVGGGSAVLGLWSVYTLVIIFGLQTAWSGPFALLLGFGYRRVAFGALIGEVALSSATVFLFSLARARAADTEQAIEDSSEPPGSDAELFFLRKSLSYSVALSRNVEAALSAAVLLPLVALGLWVLLPVGEGRAFDPFTNTAPLLVQLLIIPAALGVFGLALLLQIADEARRATSRIDRARSRIAGEGGRWPARVDSDRSNVVDQPQSTGLNSHRGEPSPGQRVHDVKTLLDRLGGSVVRGSQRVLLLTGIGLLATVWAEATWTPAFLVLNSVPLPLVTVVAFLPWGWALIRLIGRTSAFRRTSRDGLASPAAAGDWGPETTALRRLASLGDEVLVIRQIVRGVQVAVIFVAVWVAFWITLSLPAGSYSGIRWYPEVWQGALLLPVLLMTIVAARGSIVLGRLDRVQRSLERWMTGLDRLATSFWERY